MLSERPPLVCGGCTECCRGPDREFYLDHDDVQSIWGILDVVVHADGSATLPVDANGDCEYLGPGGCTVHELKPPSCRRFDCRDFVEHPSVPERVRDAAKERLWH